MKHEFIINLICSCIFQYWTRHRVNKLFTSLADNRCYHLCNHNLDICGYFSDIALVSHERRKVREKYIEGDISYYAIVVPQLLAIPSWFSLSIPVQQFNTAGLSFKDGWDFWEVLSIYSNQNKDTWKRSILRTLPFDSVRILKCDYKASHFIT